MATKIGIISFAHMHAFSYAHCLKELEADGEVEFVGLADDDADRAGQASEQFEVPVMSEDDLLAEVDGVIITTQNVLHKEKTLKAAAAGVHVLCEKPLSVSMADGREMIEACREAPRPALEPTKLRRVVERARTARWRFNVAFGRVAAQRTPSMKHAWHAIAAVICWMLFMTGIVPNRPRRSSTLRPSGRGAMIRSATAVSGGSINCCLFAGAITS